MAQRKTSSKKSSSSSSRKGSAASSRGNSSSNGSSTLRKVKLFKKQNGKWTLNWPVIIAFAVLLSIYLIVSLFNGRDLGQWKDGWDELQGNVSSSVAGLSGELSGSSESESTPAMADLADTVRVHFIDVGQGDSMLIEGDGQAVLIDAGENDKGEIVTAYLKGAGVEQLDIAVGTHPHSDHIGGLDVVIENIPVTEVWMPELPDSIVPTTRTYEDLLDAIDAADTQDYIVGPGDSAQICGGTLEVLGPVASYTDLNDMSLVIRFTYGEKSFLFTGDMEKTAEADLLAAGTDLDADVLKMGHHGSSTSSGSAFVDAVSPDIYVIEVGEGNDYGHPHKETLALLEERSAEVWRTDLNGHIVMTTDGKTITTTSQK